MGLKFSSFASANLHFHVKLSDFFRFVSETLNPSILSEGKDQQRLSPFTCSDSNIYDNGVIQQEILSQADKALVYLLISVRLTHRKIYNPKTELWQIFNQDTISTSTYGCENWKYHMDKHV